MTARMVVEKNINICENVADHIFLQNIEDCRKYFVCVDGQPKAQQCKSGLYFDANRQACIVSQQSCMKCPSNQILNLPLVKTCDKYIFCYYGQASLMKCEDSQQFNVKTGKCDLARNVDCVENHCSIHTINNELVYVPSVSSCEKYYLCMSGQAKALNCAAGLYFSTRCNCCDKAENVQCLIEYTETPLENNKEKRYFNNYFKQLHTPTLLGEANTITCPSNGIFVYQYIEDPEKYITCLEGKAMLYACAAGYQFDDRQKRCVHKDININDILDNELTHETELIQCPEFGAAILPHNQSSKYILCVNGNATVYDCPEDHYFNADDNHCHSEWDLQRKKELSRYGYVVDEVAGIVCPKYATFTFPHVEHDKFYLCIDGKATVFACAEGQHFDINEHGCVSESIELENLEEGDKLNASKRLAGDQFEFTSSSISVKCPPTGNTTLPHVLRNQYYICREGIAAVFTCPQGLLYDNKLKTCTEDSTNNEVYRPALDSDAANIMCPKFGTFKFPHLNKTMYYLCTDGKTYILACGLNEIFDVDINICREDETSLLELTNTTSKENTTQTLTPVATEIASNIICPKFGTFIYPHAQRNRYYVCIDGNAIGFVCAEGQYFDMKTNACQRLSDVEESEEEQRPVVLDEEPVNILCPSVGAMKFAHEEKHKFYLCVNGMATVLACANGSFFEVETGACRRSFVLVSNENETVSNENETVSNGNETVKCPMSGTFIYPHAEENQYYVCFEGKALVLSCPEGLVFDTKEKTCRIPVQNENVETEPLKVLDEIVNIICPASGAYKYPHAEKHKFYLCVNGMASVLACANGSIFESETGDCRRSYSLESNGNETAIAAENATLETDTDETVKCPMSGTFIYPHAENNQYYVCLEGKALVLSCPEGLVFDTKEKTCLAPDQSENVEIETPNILDEIVNIICPASGAYKYPHVEKHKFYLCVNGMASVLACANGSFFESETGDCRRMFSLGNSGNETFTVAVNTTDIENTTVTENATLVTDSNSTLNCPLSGTFISPHAEKNQYHVCLEGKALVMSCPEGLVFDTKEKTCLAPVQSESVKIETPKVLDEIVNIMCPASGAYKYPHIEKYKFYLCVNGMGSVMACPGNSVFDKETGRCLRKATTILNTTLESNVSKEAEPIMDNSTLVSDNNVTDIEKNLSLNSLAESAETFNITCPELGTFLYPHDEKHKYFICLDGTAIEFTCAKGLIFDVTGNVCVEDPAVENQDIKCPVQGTDMLPHKQDTNKFYLCIKGIAIIQSCAAGDFFDAETKTCRETIAAIQTSQQQTVDVKCPLNGTRKVNHVDPNKFYLCIDGLATIHSCAKGDYFDAESETCREPLQSSILLPLENKTEQTSSAENTLTEPFNTLCPPQGIALIAHINSNKFYQCVDGVATLQNCAEGDYFDVETQTCSEPTVSILLTIENKTEQTSSAENTLTEPLNALCPPRGTALIAHLDSNKFYQCVDGIATLQNCDEGDYFDVETQTCSEPTVSSMCPPQGTALIPHTDSNKFYQCIDGVSTLQNCAPGDFFDVEIHTCREAFLNGVMPRIECPEKGTFIYPLPHKNTYYVCSDGKARDVYCAEGDIFDVELNACREVNKEETSIIIENPSKNQEKPKNLDDKTLKKEDSEESNAAPKTEAVDEVEGEIVSDKILDNSVKESELKPSAGEMLDKAAEDLQEESQELSQHSLNDNSDHILITSEAVEVIAEMERENILNNPENNSELNASVSDILRKVANELDITLDGKSNILSETKEITIN